MKKFLLIYVSAFSFFGGVAFPLTSTNNIPVFDSPAVDGIQLTIRLSEYDYAFDEPVNIQCWIINRSAAKQTVCIFPLEFTLFAKLERDGKFVFDTEDGFVAEGDFAEGIGDRKPAKENYFELESGWSLRIESEGEYVPLHTIIGRSLNLGKQQITAGEYNLTLRFSQKVFNGEDFGVKSWMGTVESNTVKLRILPPPDADALLKQLDAPSAKTRAKAAGMLGNMKEPRAVEPLIALLKDNDAQVRLNAVAALGIFADSSAVEPLIPLLDDNDALVVRYTAKSLAKIGDKRSVQPLVKKLSSDSATIKCDILEALKILSDPDSAIAVDALLKDKKRSVRYTALHSIPTLLVTNPAHRNEILKSLIASTSDEYFKIRGDSASALVEFSDSQDVVDAIIKLLKDKNAYARLNAVLAIGKIEPAGAVDLLIPLRQDEDSEVQNAADEAIRRMEKSSTDEGNGNGE